MKSLSIYSLSAFVLACSLFIACGNNEQDVVPQMNNVKQTKAEPAKAPAEEEPQLVPIESLSDKKDSQDNEMPKVEAVPEVSNSEDIQPLAQGTYVIQVSIQPSKKSADGIVKKLAENNIKAYVAEVENPGELEGTYYRVRVGFFSSIKMAQDYGKQVLSSLNFAWWVDNSNNDEVGNPSGGYNNDYNSESYYAPTEETTYTEEQSTQVEESAPAEQPINNQPPAPAPVQETPQQPETQVPSAPEPPATDDWE